MTAYDWDFTALMPYRFAFLRGALATLELSIVCIVLGTSLGLVSSLLLRSSNVGIRTVAQLAVDVIRSIPPLVLILICYYGLPLTFNHAYLSPFIVAATALSLNLAAFVADAARSALNAVPRAHLDAAAAVGLTRSQIMRVVTLPEAGRRVLPSLLLLYIGTIKLTSIASVISVQEVTHAANSSIIDTFRSLESYVVITAFYVSVIMPLSFLARRLEQSLATKHEAV